MTPEVDVRTAHTRMLAGEPLIDVREPHEWEEAHIPGAVLIPQGEVPDRLDEIPEGPVLVHCRSGIRSATVVDWLRANGRPDAVNVEGGILSWAKQGLPVEEP